MSTVWQWHPGMNRWTLGVVVGTWDFNGETRSRTRRIAELQRFKARWILYRCDERGNFSNFQGEVITQEQCDHYMDHPEDLVMEQLL